LQAAAYPEIFFAVAGIVRRRRQARPAGGVAVTGTTPVARDGFPEPGASKMRGAEQINSASFHFNSSAVYFYLEE
jgi:hypothetical protein